MADSGQELKNCQSQLAALSDLIGQLKQVSVNSAPKKDIQRLHDALINHIASPTVVPVK